MLSRQTPNKSLVALVSALKPEVSNIPLAETAIGFHSSVFLRLGAHAKSEDIIDYLSSRHSAPLILPGQAIQEFWNNQLQVVDTIAANVKSSTIPVYLRKADPYFAHTRRKCNDLLEEFRTQHGHVYDEVTVRRTVAVLELLQQRALVAYAPRPPLRHTANKRGHERHLDLKTMAMVISLSGQISKGPSTSSSK